MKGFLQINITTKFLGKEHYKGSSHRQGSMSSEGIPLE